MLRLPPVQHFYQGISRFRIPIILITLLLSVFFSLAAFVYPKVVFNPNLASLIPKVSGQGSVSPGRTESDYLVVAVQAKAGKTLFSPEVLHAVQQAIRHISAIEHLSVPVSPFEQLKINIIQKNGRVKTYKPLPILQRDPASPAGVLYPIASMEAAADFKAALLQSPIAKRLVINETGDLLAFLVDHKTHPMSMQVPQLVRNELLPYSDLFDAHIAGLSSFEESVSDYLMRDLVVLMGIGLLFILIIFYFSFFSVRAVLLPTFVGLIGTVWMLGALALLHIELSVVCIVCPPLVLALSSSYCIHALNQYYREDYALVPKGCQPVFYSVSKISPTVFSATLTTVIALAGLYISKITQTMDFGIATSFGISFCALLALFFLPSVLSFLPLPSVQRKDKINSDFFAKFFHRSAPGLVRFRFLILVFFILAVASPLVSRFFMKYDSDYINYFPQESQVVKETTLISRQFSGVSQIYIDYKINDEKLNQYISDRGLDPATAKRALSDFNNNEALLTALSDYEAALSRHRFVPYLLSYTTLAAYINSRLEEDPPALLDKIQRLKLTRDLQNVDIDSLQLISRDGKILSSLFRISDPALSHGYVKEEDFNRFIKGQKADLSRLQETFPYLEADFDGYRVGMLHLRSQMNRDLTFSTLLSLLLIFIVVTLIFKNAFYGLYALIPTLIGITLNFTLMALLRIPLDMTTLMVTSAIIGIGVDDSIHFLLNFRSLYAQRNPADARLRQLSDTLTACLEKTGRPIVLTSLAIVLGMSTMLFSTFKPIGYFGTLIALSLVTTTIGCLFFLPVFIVFHYTFSDWLHKKRADRSPRPKKLSGAPQ